MAREKLFKIGEIMEYTGLSRQTIHNYTLAGLLVEAKRTPSGHRLYAESVFDYIERIKGMQETQHTLKQIKDVFEEERRIHEASNGKQLSIDFDEGLDQ